MVLLKLKIRLVRTGGRKGNRSVRAPGWTVLIPLSQLPEATEQQRLAELESRGLVTLPRRPKQGFQGSAVPNRGKLASEMISEDRR
jgi:hypothetical protein